MRRTKIIATIGPTSESPEVMRGLIRAGMDVARINLSHGDWETHARNIFSLRQIAREEGRLLAVMVDLQGPKLRVGELPGEGVELKEGETVLLTVSPSSPDHIPVPHPAMLRDLREGQRVLLDDGRLELIVEDAQEGDGVRCRVVTGGRLTSHKGLNLPGAPPSMAALTSKDRKDVRFAVEQKVDLMALSFVRSAQDLQKLRDLLTELRAEGKASDHPNAQVSIVAKIEKAEALESFDGILEEADAIMVARGDLGVETSPEDVPFHQKEIIWRCNQVGKPVITATQMLQSMVDWPTPTRAEASDVVNAILDGTDAVMLSGETAIGAYPVEALRMMTRISVSAENHLPRSHFANYDVERAAPSCVTEAISRATVEIADTVSATAIITATMSGTTARMVARHRPAAAVVAVTPNFETLMRLKIVWGVTPIQVSRFANTDEMVALMVQAAYEGGLVKEGDRVVLTAGLPFGGEGLTNMIKVHRVGDTIDI